MVVGMRMVMVMMVVVMVVMVMMRMRMVMMLDPRCALSYGFTAHRRATQLVNFPWKEDGRMAAARLHRANRPDVC